MRITQGRRFRTTTPRAQVAEAQRRVIVADVRQQLAKDTKWVNRVLAEMTHNTYFDSVPLDRVNDALRAHGFEELQGMLLCGREGRINEDIGRNRWLALTWYRMESGRYEVVAYVS